MVEFMTFLAEHGELLLFILVGIGAIIGHFSVRGISLGAAAVLFLAIAISAAAASVGVAMEVPAVLGHVGLAMFTFSVGIASGPTFFHAMKTSAPAILGVVLAIIVGGVVAFFVGPLLGLTIEQSAGTFAGALTNTPALAAAGNSPEATVGYSVAYLFGVIGMLIVTIMALRHSHEDADDPVPLIQRHVRIERIRPGVTVGDFEELHEGEVSITRVRHEEEGPVQLGTDQEPLEIDDVITVVGPEPVVKQVIRELGHESSHRLAHDRATLDFRRITMSEPRIAGKTIAELDLENQFGATISRVRRVDVDMLAHPDMVLQLGDRVRIVAPRSRIAKVAAFFGDSDRGLTRVNPASLGVGMTIGILVGMIPFPLPGGGVFTLGSALGCLLIGLIMGRVGRIGNVVTALPYTVTAVLSEIGLLFFLAQAGARSGSMILKAFESGQWAGMFILGILITSIVGASVYVFQRQLMHMGGTRLSGLVAGTQTQPALLAYANNKTGYDFRVAAGYTMAYPFAMVAKIVVASVIHLAA